MAKKKRKRKSRIGSSDRSKEIPASRPHTAGGEFLVLAFLAVVVFGIYSNTLQNPFVLDDIRSIQHNSHIRVNRLNFEAIKRAGFEGPLPQRPLANISFALNFYVHQLDVAGYHVLNILIHIACGLFLYLLVKTTLNSPALRTRSHPYAWTPLLTTVIWLVHPIQIQSVTYVVQRMNSLAAMFYVLSLLLYARARQTEQRLPGYALFAGCIISGTLALGSKEIAATLPAIILLYEWYFLQDLSWIWLKRRLALIAAVVAVIALVGLSYLDFQPLEKILNSYGGRDFTVIQRVLTEFRVIVFYISLILLPHPARLNLDHHVTVSHSLFDPITTVPAIGFIAGLVVLALYTARRQRLMSFCFLWYLGNLIIESSVIGLEIIFEHRNYLPSMFLILMVVMPVDRFIRRPGAKAGILAAVALVLCIWTYDRNALWRDPVTLWRDCAAKSPNKARPHNNLGAALARRGSFAEAVVNYRKVLLLKPDYAEAHYGLGAIRQRQGRFESAQRHYVDALNSKPDYPEAHHNLGVLLYRQGRLQAAVEHYRAALRIKADYAQAHNNLGAAFDDLGQIDRALYHYREALKIEPNLAGAHNNLGIALAMQGDLKAAISHFSEALRINPDDALTHSNQGNALAGAGRYAEATRHYHAALQINPDDAEVRRNLEKALKRMGK
jgi:Flp pilus assembly protein TadD